MNEKKIDYCCKNTASCSNAFDLLPAIKNYTTNQLVVTKDSLSNKLVDIINDYVPILQCSRLVFAEMKADPVFDIFPLEGLGHFQSNENYYYVYDHHQWMIVIVIVLQWLFPTLRATKALLARNSRQFWAMANMMLLS